MRIQTNRGIYTYNYVEKRKLGDLFILVGVADGNTLVNLCEPVKEEEVIDQYINFIKYRLNEAEKNNRGTNLVIDLSNLKDFKDSNRFCLIAYTWNGRPCIALERNYIGVEGEINILNNMIRTVEERGCVVTNSCSMLVLEDRIMLKEIAKTSIYSVDYILMRSGYDKRVIQHMEDILGRSIPFRFEYRQNGSKVIRN